MYSITEYRDMIGQKVYYPIHKIATSEHPPLPICNNDVGDWIISMSITTVLNHEIDETSPKCANLTMHKAEYPRVPG